MIRNVSYAFGVIADRAPADQFGQYQKDVLATVKQMYATSESNGDHDAKDNCLATIVKVMDRFASTFSPDEFATLMS